MSDLSGFEEFCGSVFWNGSTVYTSKPDLTPCFESTILVWVPCLILWLMSPFWAYMIKRERVTRAGYSWLTFTKTIILILLTIIEIGHLVLSITRSSNGNYSVYGANYLSPSVLIVSYCIVMFFMYYELKYGLRSSVLLFVFWLSLLLLSTLTFLTKIIQYNETYPNIDYWDFILFYEFYGLVLVMLILSLFSERLKTNRVDPEGIADKTNKRPFPEPYAPLLSRITFWWINPMIVTGYKKDLTRDDMWDIDPHEQCDHLTKKLERQWNKAAEEYMKKVQVELEEHERNGGTIENFEPKTKEPSLAFCLCKIFAGKFIAGGFLKLIQDLLTFVGPTILNLLIEFTNDRSQNALVGYFFTALLFFSTVTQTLMVQHYFHRMFIVGARIRTALMGLIYKKSLRLSTASRKGATTGEIVNLMQVNTQTFVDLTPYLNMLWSAPLQIIVSIAMLWQYLGVASLAGLATMVIFIPINIFLSNRSKVLQTQKLKLQDSRIKLTNEILNGIKVLKLYGWELSFKNILEKIRETELGVLLRMGTYNTIISFSWGAASFLVATASFIAYILMDENNNLDASTAFVSLTLFNIIRFPLMILPQVITSLIQANVSMTRIRRFLLKDELDESQITHEEIPNTPVLMEEVNLGWDQDNKTLKDINLTVKKGELVAIVGAVGAGKSSLLSGVLGEMHKHSGRMNTTGSMAYVAQQAWIQNATLKNNILFGSEFDEAKYERILDACALRTDLTILPAGDATEIGEKGINLSGGQKQRVSLSRAVYNDADTYMLDDPLSAVDAHVGKHIFEQVLGPKGLLRNKTRIFATNNLTFLHQCDRVVYLEKGRIKEIGTYAELTTGKTALSAFIGEYLNSHKNEEGEDAEESKDKKKDKKKEADKKPEKKNDEPKDAEKEKAGEKLVVKEKVESGKVKLSVLIDYFKSCTVLFSVFFMIFYILTNVAQSAVSIYLSDWSNNADNPDDNKYVRLGVYTALGLVQYALLFFGDLSNLKMLMRSARYLHSSMLYSILRSSMQFFESTPVGRIINRFSKDIEAVEMMIPAAYKMLIRCLFQVILTIIVISISTPLFLVPLVPISVIYIYVQRYYVASMRQLRRLNSVSKSPIFSHFGETLTGLGTIRAYAAQNRFVKIMENKIDENLIYYYPDTVSNRWLAVRLEFIGTLVTLFACLFTVISRDSLSSGQAGLSISYSLNIAQILNWLVRMSADFESAVTSVERIKEYCETPHEASWTSEKPPANEWPQHGQIDFKNYSVKYREELDFVLRGIDCSIQPGEKIGIVGRTGAGKSSLTLGLFRILESTFGSIVIDDWNIRDMGLHDLRKKLTIIPQDPVLFSGTLRINLDPFELYSDEKIWQALRNAHLYEFVMSLDKKLEFECSEGGENLSVGQRQLVCLARALLRKTKILILDEATAAVDMNTDDLIQSTIRTEFADCTVLTIAHRLNTIMDYTRVMVLDQGSIIEFDSPANLLANQRSVFYSMAVSAGLIQKQS